MNEKCPKCETVLRKENVVQVNGHGVIKTVGEKYFCPNRECDYETRCKNVSVDKKPRW